MTIPIQGVSSITSLNVVDANISPGLTGPASGTSFGQMLTHGVERVNANLLEAESVTRAFAVGEDIPVHQVTFAIEQARLSLELLSQVRTRLVEGFQEILRMQV